MAEKAGLPFELAEGEVVEKEFASDYWEKVLFAYSQVRGRYYFTNQRVIFVSWGQVKLDLPYNKMVAAVSCNVGALLRLIPTGIKVTMDDEKSYMLSVTKRNENLEFIKGKMLQF